MTAGLDERVLVLAPVGRDAALATELLRAWEFDPVACDTVASLAAELERGAGVLLVAEEAVRSRHAAVLREAIGRQPAWSDVPIVMVSSSDGTREGALATVGLVASFGSVSVVERPVRVAALVTALRAAIRARRRQYQVRDLVAELERGVRARDQFMALLGHELRNPLAGIVYALELLDRAPHDEAKSARWRGIIRRQSGILARLIDEFLDVARITSGKLVLDASDVDLAEVVAQVVEAQADAVAKAGLTLVHRGPPSPLVVHGDAVRLAQVASNLLANAIKYTPSGGHLEVSLARDGDQAVLAVADDGVGISPELIGRVFEPFVQEDESLDRSRGGMGLGLALVRRLVELHGGTVRAESAGRGRGARFEVRLPAAPAVAASAPPEAADERPTQGRRVLLVEDNADLRDALQEWLEDAGHRVDVAGDGPSGVAHALASPPDVALVDIGLPGLDGYDVARAIRAGLGATPFLAALTGYSQPDDRRRTAEAGFDAHLGKPVSLEAVSEVLRAAGARER